MVARAVTAQAAAPKSMATCARAGGERHKAILDVKEFRAGFNASSEVVKTGANFVAVDHGARPWRSHVCCCHGLRGQLELRHPLQHRVHPVRPLAQRPRGRALLIQLT
jgi:hypothetical protein